MVDGDRILKIWIRITLFNNGLIICFVQCEDVNRRITLSVTFKNEIFVSIIGAMNENWNLTYSSVLVNLSTIQLWAKTMNGSLFNAGVCGLLCIGY